MAACSIGIGSTKVSVREQALRAMSVHRYLDEALGEPRSVVAVTQLESALLNNELRWKSWLATAASVS